jgi:hypothetical protein
MSPFLTYTPTISILTKLIFISSILSIVTYEELKISDVKAHVEVIIHPTKILNDQDAVAIRAKHNGNGILVGKITTKLTYPKDNRINHMKIGVEFDCDDSIYTIYRKNLVLKSHFDEQQQAQAQAQEICTSAE